MEPVPYEIRVDDVDEVLTAHETDWTDAERAEARSHVLRNVMELNEAVRSTPEDESGARHDLSARVQPEAGHPGDASPARRDMALAAIEDLLIRDGFIDIEGDDDRIYPMSPER